MKTGGFLRYLRDFVQVRTCPGCEELLPRENRYGPFCDACRARWEREKLRPCPVCGCAMIDCGCLPRLLCRSDAIDRAVFLVSYQPGGGSLPDQTVYRLKEYADRELFTFLARELSYGVARAIALSGADPGEVRITALPARRSALRERGFDQAVELARALSAVTGYPYVKMLTRTKGRSGRREQKSLSAKERLESMRNAFQTVEGRMEGATILLVDDLITTGAGMAAGAELLRAAGARRVIPSAIARTLS